MATQFSGGTYVNTTFTGGIKQDIIDGIETALLAAGWTTISGHSTTNLLMQSATQANVTNPIRVRIKDNSGSCVQVSILNQAGTNAGGNTTSNGGNLLPATAKTFRVLATQYHFMCFTPGTSAAREFVMAGMLYVPSFLTGIADHGYMFCNSIADGNGTHSSSFRYGPSLMCAGSAGAGLAECNSQVIWNTNLFENASNGTSNYNAGTPETVIFNIAGVPNSNAYTHWYRWANDDINTSDVLLGAGLNGLGDEAKIKGQFFDMVFIADAFAGDATDTFSGHNWWNVTNNNTGATNCARGGIWMATS